MQNTNVRNTADQGAKLVFKNAEMCAQFLEDYIPIPCLKGLKPEQIEDMSALADIFSDYLPDFRYEVIRLHDYSNDEIIQKGNELSLVMLINKLSNSADIRNLKNIPEDYLKNLSEHSPQHLLQIIAEVISAFMHKLNVPDQEIALLTDKIFERRLSMLFDNFEAYDVQAIRRTSKIEGKIEDLLSFLDALGSVPKELSDSICKQTDLNILNHWIHIAVKCHSITEFEEKIK